MSECCETKELKTAAGMAAPALNRSANGKTLVIIGGLLCGASAHAQCCAPTPVATPKVTAQPVAAPDVRTVTLKVTGMTCEMCAKEVERALQNVDGARTADVSPDKKQAVVTGDAAKVNTEQLLVAVAKAGGGRHTFKAENVGK